MELVKDYNTGRDSLVLREYGRNIQKLIDYIRSMDDKEKRTKYATTLVNLMRQIVPGSTANQENEQKFWDDLYIISRMDMDIDAPFPKPEEKMLYRKPDRVAYHNYHVKLKHYGRNIELLIKKAIDLEDPAEKESAIIYIGKLMKTFQSSWNKENVEDSVVVKNITELSGGLLSIDLDKVVKDNLFEVLYKDKGKPRSRRNHGPSRGSGGRGQGSGKNQNRRRRK